MGSLIQHKGTRKTSHIINMTHKPIHLYEDYSGKIVTIFQTFGLFAILNHGNYFLRMHIMCSHMIWRMVRICLRKITEM